MSTAVDRVQVQRAGPVLTVTFARPEALNAVDLPMLSIVAEALESAATDPGIRVVVLTGAGRAFCSGADLGGSDDSDGSTASTGSEGASTAPTDGGTLDAVNRVIRAIVASPAPVVAAVNGPAAGVGCSFALAADLVVAAESAYFLLAFTRVGLMPDGGATALVAAAIGRARAMRMALLAERLPAATAAQWGLISHVVPDDDLTATVDSLVQTLGAGPPGAYALTKAAVNEGGVPELARALARERQGQMELLASADFAQGVAAFRERRPARFGGG